MNDSYIKYVYIILLAVIVASMFTQWLNMGVWLFLVSVPGYEDLVTNFSELFRPALTSISFLIPITIAYKIFNFLFFASVDHASWHLSDKTSLYRYRHTGLAVIAATHNFIYCIYQ